MTECVVSKVRLSCFRSKAFRDFLLKVDDVLFEIEQKEAKKDGPNLVINAVEIYDDKIRYKGVDYLPFKPYNP